MGHIRSTCTVKPFYKLLTKKLFQYPVSYAFWNEKLYLEYSEVFITRWNVYGNLTNNQKLSICFWYRLFLDKLTLLPVAEQDAVKVVCRIIIFIIMQSKRFFSNSNNIRRQSIRFDGITNKNT